MKIDKNAGFFWGSDGHLSSLSNFVLLFAVTSRMAHAILISLVVFLVFTITSLVMKASAILVPRRHDFFIRVLIVSAFTAVASRLFSIFWPITVRDCAFYLGAIPLCYLSGSFNLRCESKSPLAALILSIKDTLVFSALAFALALVREPFGYGAISVPGPEGVIEFFGLNAVTNVGARFASAGAGAFILIGYLVALYRKIRFRLYGKPLCGENE